MASFPATGFIKNPVHLQIHNRGFSFAYRYQHDVIKDPGNAVLRIKYWTPT